MITIKDKQYRNLEEQVRRNTEILNFIPNGLAGADFLGILDAEPTPAENIGKTYLSQVATDKYHLFYIDANKGPVDLGAFPAEGPQGEPGIAIPTPGPQGEEGVGWLVGSNYPTTEYDGSPLRDHSLFYNFITNNVYSYDKDTNTWTLIGNIKGDTGPQGASIAGPQGPQGPVGPAGADGKPGMSYAILGIVENITILSSITPEDGAAYLVGTHAPYSLYIAFNNKWNNLGIFPNYSQVSLVNTLFVPTPSAYQAVSQSGLLKDILDTLPIEKAGVNIYHYELAQPGYYDLSGNYYDEYTHYTTPLIAVDTPLTVPQRGKTSTYALITAFDEDEQYLRSYIDSDLTLRGIRDINDWGCYIYTYTPAADEKYVRITFLREIYNNAMVVQGDYYPTTDYPHRLAIEPAESQLRASTNYASGAKTLPYLCGSDKVVNKRIYFIGDDFLAPYAEELASTLGATYTLKLRNGGCILADLEYSGKLPLKDISGGATGSIRIISCGFDDFFQPTTGAGPRITSTASMGTYNNVVANPADKTTIYGQLDRIAYLLSGTNFTGNQNSLNYWILPHRMFADSETGTINNDITWEEYREAIKKVCHKWGIHVIDLQEVIPPVAGGLSSNAQYYADEYVAGDKYALIRLKDSLNARIVQQIANQI